MKATLRARQLRWFYRSAAALPLVVAVIVVGIWPMDAWWHHELRPDTVIGHLAVQDWARIGKLLLFAAGLVVVVDLVGPARIRRWADGLEARREQLSRASEVMRSRHPVAAQRRRMESSLIALVGEPDGSLTWRELTNGPPPVAVLPEIGQDGLDEWHAVALARLHGPHACDSRHATAEPCDWQELTSQVAVDEYLTGHLPDTTIDDLESLADLVTRAYLTMSGAVAVVGFTILGALAFTGVNGLLIYCGFGVVALVAGVLGVTCTAHPPVSGPGTLPIRAYAWVAGVPAASALRVAAVVVGWNRAGHPLKIVAFDLFLVGCLVDLLTA